MGYRSDTLVDTLVFIIAFIILLIPAGIGAAIFTLPFYPIEQFKMKFMFRQAPNFLKWFLYPIFIFPTIFVFLFEAGVILAIFDITIINSTIDLLVIIIPIFISDVLPFIRMKKFKKDLEQKSKKELEKAAEKDRNAIEQATKQLQALREIYPELKQKYEARKEIYEIIEKCAYIYVDIINTSAILKRHMHIPEKSKNDELSFITPINVMNILANLTLDQYERHYSKAIMTAMHRYGNPFDLWCEYGIRVYLSEMEAH